MTETAKKCARRMLGCYRVGDAHDPETYITAVVAVLVGYPVWIIQSVTDPASGIPSKIKFLPAVAEVKTACEELYGPHRYAEEWDKRASVTVESRLALPNYRPQMPSPQQYTYREAEAWSKAKGEKQFRPVGRFEQRAEFIREEPANEPQPLDTIPEPSDALLGIIKP